MAITGTNLYNLTKKREGARKTEFAMRVNKTATLAATPELLGGALSKTARNALGHAGYTPRVRENNEAMPRTYAGCGAPYDGAELRPYQDRPGALAFKALPSRGF